MTSIRCKHCGDTIESKHRHDFRSCSCKSVAVDGGTDCPRVIWPGGEQSDHFEWVGIPELLPLRDDLAIDVDSIRPPKADDPLWTSMGRFGATVDPVLDELVKLREANAALVRKLGVANARIKVEEDKRKKYRSEQDRYRTRLLEAEARNAKLMGELREAEERLRRALEREAASWAK